MAEKQERFAFKSAKGKSVSVDYTPSEGVKVSDKKAFEGYMKKVVDFIEVDAKVKEPKENKEEKGGGIDGISEETS